MSVAEARYCAMGEQCKLYDPETGRAQKLGRYHKDDICGRCARAGYTLEDAPAAQGTGGVAESGKTKRCVSCGSTETGARIDLLGDHAPFCASCWTQAQVVLRLNYPLLTKEDSPLPVEERFDELFKAAKVLLRENAKEHEIIPTLALANLLGHGVPRLVAEKERFAKLWKDEQVWNKEADGFAHRYGGLRPVRFVRETLILEKLPARIEIDYDDHGENPEVVIYAYPHQTTLADPKDVASLYDKTMAKAGISCDEERTGELNFRFINDTLMIRLRPGPGTTAERVTITEGTTVPQPGWRIDKASFPHPRIVQTVYAGLRSEFVRDLTIRQRSHPPEAENLVPACVVFLLREYYGTKDRKKLHGLLTKYVLHEMGDAWKSHVSEEEKDNFRDAVTSSLTNQLGNKVNNKASVGDPLLDASRTLFYGGEE